MKKKFLILPVLAALFAACTSDELVVVDNQTQQTVEDGAIAFDAYLNRAVTRAGYVGNINTAALRSAGVGFGVFAYYANGDLYSENAIPDFMYNQEVKFKDTPAPGFWEYSPLKYWPNEFGSTAISTGVDRVTFFAYAPYVGVDPATGQLTSHYTNDPASPELSTETGITALTRNGKTGDPYVRYVVAFEPDKCVDLLYGVAADNFTSSVGAADGANSIKAGDPFINVAKPDVSSRLKFNFKHALAKLNVKVDADVDILNHDEGDALDGNTRIWVRSITFDGVAQRGYLNLNSGMWYDVIDNTKISHASVTAHDGRRDGAEALADDSYETPIGFNPELVQQAEYTTEPDYSATGTPIYSSVTTTTTGVTAANQNLFSGSNDLLVIPANEQLKVTIVYDVETADPTLPSYLSDGKTKGSTVENKITKSITLGGNALKLEAGNAYTINLHLGMTSVKFDAQVSAWVDDNTGDNAWLPENGPAYAAAKPLTSVTATLSAEQQTFNFAITGLNSGEAVSASSPESPLSAPTVNPADASGVAIESIAIAANKSVKDKTCTNVTWTGATSEKGISLVIKQKAHELGLGVSGITSNTIVLSSTAESLTDAWWNHDNYGVDKDNLATNKNVIVKKNGTVLTYTSSTPDVGEFTFNNGTITLDDGQVAIGDVFSITVKAGDAPAETYVLHIGGIYFSPKTGSVEYNPGSNTYTVPEATLVGYGSVAYSNWTAINDVVTAFNPSTRVATLGGIAASFDFQATLTPEPHDGWIYLSTTDKFELTVTTP